jgi:CMP-N-acetylneuraminic acid synthetase
MTGSSSPAVLATICARGGSKGVRGKNARFVGGRPLIAYTIEAARSCPAVGHIVVSTDSEEIAVLAEECGIRVPFRRPAELASDTAAKIGAIRHATEYVERHDHFYPDIVVDLDVGTPLRVPADITVCIERFRANDVDAVVTVYEAERNPYFNMVEFEADYVKLVKRPERMIVRRQDAPLVYSVTPSVFAFKRDRLMEVTHLFEGKWGACIVPRERAIDIDEELDLKFVEFLMTHAATHDCAPR